MKALRIDDIGASSKLYEIYGKTRLTIKGKKIPIPIPGVITNFLFLKHFPLWKGWGPYNELSSSQWDQIFNFFIKYNIKASVAITSNWVEADGSLTPFNKKFKDQHKSIKEGISANLIEVLSHGLTHCVVGEHLPFKFKSNRQQHREFYDYLGKDKIYEHAYKSKNQLEDMFGVNVDVLVPPGNVFGKYTIEACQKIGYKAINCNTQTRFEEDLLIIGNENVYPIHDRDFITENDCDQFLQNFKNSVLVSDIISKYEK